MAQDWNPPVVGSITFSPKQEPAVRAFYGEIERLRAENERLRKALKGLADMYTHAWDLVDGGLMMIGPSIPKFEKAHAAAQRALTPPSTPDRGE